MNDLRKTILILTGTTLFFVLLQGFTKSDYAIPNSSLNVKSLTPGEFADKIRSGDKSVTIVDLRPEADFQAGNLEGSVNIPFEKLGCPETLKKMHEHGNIVFVGNDEAKAHQAALFCTFKGISAMAVNGNVALLQQLAKGEKPDAWRFYSAEKQRFNYRNYFRHSTTAPTSNTEVKKEVKVSAGGC
jgi:rhodanese-related sulfurtransferase